MEVGVNKILQVGMIKRVCPAVYVQTRFVQARLLYVQQRPIYVEPV